MEGFKYNSQDPQRGIIPRSMEEIFKYIENSSNSKSTFMVRASYLQIYNEVISDLLRTDRTNLHIREDKKKGVFVEGLSEWAVRSPNEIYSLMQKGAMSRATASTKMNDVSSRSHAVFIIIVEHMSHDEESNGAREIRVGKLNLVDLAGSERVRVTGATGKRLEECKKINQSLSALGNVISALTDQKQPKTHIPYRDSKITRLLEDSLGGNCITTMMAMVSPALEAFNESLSSLKFANRAKNIRNEPVINEDVDQKALLRKYEAELKRLRTELEEKNRHLIDKKRLLQLEEERRRAEQDKAAAVTALEARSREFMQEREEKKRLEVIMIL
jgi:Kinesin-like protein